jgi:RNA polymerase sigma-70 factor (ECF subfamily)
MSNAVPLDSPGKARRSEAVDGAALTPNPADDTAARRARDAEFDAAYRNAYARLVRIAERHTREPHGAQDLLQAAAYKAFVRWRAGKPIDNLEGYLTACLLSTCIDMHRWSKRQRRALERLAASDFLDAPSAHDPILQRAERESVDDAFQRLSRDCREILTRRVLDGVSVRKVAQELSIPEGTVKSRCSRCLDQLGRLLSD